MLEMLEVNLSRVHHMISDYNGELSELIGGLRKASLKYIFRIYEGSTEGDYKNFEAQLLKRKKDYEYCLARMKNIMAYMEYLKKAINNANQTSGIGDKLIEASFLKRRISICKDFADSVGENISTSMNAPKSVDFYKSTFTDQAKMFDLYAYLFSEDDWRAMRGQIEDMTSQYRALNDEIATLNQKTVVKIKSFEEFSS